MGQTKNSKPKKEPLFKVYSEYLENKVTMKSFSHYINVDNILNKNDNPEVAKQFLVLLPKLLKRKEGKILIERLIEEIEDKLYIDLSDNKKSYLRKFFNYIENITVKDCKQIIELYDEKLLELNKDDNDFLNQCKTFTKNQLISKFKSRLKTQDRISGDKIWLPLRYIAKIYRQAPKSQVNPQEESKKNFTTWLNSITKNIYILYTDDLIDVNNNNVDNCVSSIKYVKLAEIDSLILKKDNNNEFKVLIEKEGEKLKHVLTPTGKGNEKEIMRVKSIRDIAIDHVIPIDSILRKLEDDKKLPLLKMVSDSYKALQELKDPKEKKAIDELLKDNDFFKLDLLYDELKMISDGGPLRLMSAKYNSQKSNELTFKKIYLKGGKYEGIIEEGIIYDADNKPNMILYQKLEENGITRIKHKDNYSENDIYYDFEKIITDTNTGINKIDTIIDKI